VNFSGSSYASISGVMEVKTVHDSDHYTVETVANAAATVAVGGSNVLVHGIQKRYDSLFIQGRASSPPKCNVATSVKPTFADKSASVQWLETPMNQFTHLRFPSYMFSPASGVAGDTVSSGAYNTLPVQMQLTSSNPYVSPVVDTSSLRVITLSNRVASPTKNNIGISLFDMDVEWISNDGSTLTSFDAVANTITTNINVQYLKPGNYIVIGGSTSNTNKKFVVDSVTLGSSTHDVVVSSITDGVSMVTEAAEEPTKIGVYNYISDPKIPVGDTHEAVYVTNQTSLETMCTGFRILVDTKVPQGTDVRIFYRAGVKNSFIGLDSIVWTEVETNDINNNTTFIERRYDVDGLNDFNTFQFKVVFESDTSTIVPEAKNLRIIALA
jgi:hypothetical protein